MKEANTGFAFPGMELFGEEEAQRLGSLIQNIQAFRPVAVQGVCEALSIGWTGSGFPDYRGVARIESFTNLKACAMVALETARGLGGDLATSVTLDLIEQGGRLPENMPQVVYHYLQQQSGDLNS